MAAAFLQINIEAMQAKRRPENGPALCLVCYGREIWDGREKSVTVFLVPELFSCGLPAGGVGFALAAQVFHALGCFQVG